MIPSKLKANIVTISKNSVVFTENEVHFEVKFDISYKTL